MSFPAILTAEQVQASLSFFCGTSYHNNSLTKEEHKIQAEHKEG